MIVTPPLLASLGRALSAASFIALTLFAAGAAVIAVRGAIVGRPLLPHRPVREVPWGLIDVAFIFALWLGAQLALGILALIIAHRALIYLTASVTSLAALALAARYLAVRYPAALRDAVGRTRWPRDGFLGLAAAAVAIPPVFALMALLVTLFPYRHESLEAIQESPQIATLVAIWISAALVAPLVEEFMFRFVLQAWLQRWSGERSPAHRLRFWWGDRIAADRGTIAAPGEGEDPTRQAPRRSAWLAIGLTSLLFAGMHAEQGLSAVVALMLFSLGLGVLFQRTGSWLSCVTMHAGLNIYSLTWQTWLAVELSQLGPTATP